MVMKGWFTIYTSDDPRSPFTKLSARTQFLTKIKELVEQYKGEELSLTITGHSLGACLPILSAFDVVENGLWMIPVAAIMFVPNPDTGLPVHRYKLVIDNRKSSSLRDSKNPSDWHNLQGMLHVGVGWNGADRDFELKVKRSIALVNKSGDYLKEELLVPPSWWVEKNKGMELDESGEWVLTPPFDDDNIPVPEF
uniref:Phospholipase A1 n=1 Tax=Nelumbo nucifera TaxID=4432 RepID=A0A822XUV9_NELNU|nr:TPA_asm: hypothetical protein HUJ06_022701 [Nelumbo nucifera]